MITQCYQANKLRQYILFSISQDKTYAHLHEHRHQIYYLMITKLNHQVIQLVLWKVN